MSGRSESINLRPATSADKDILLAWRNEPTTRQMSLTDHEVTAEEHAAWFDASFGNPARLILIAEIDGQSAGMVRYDKDGETAEVSINIAPEARGHGMGARLLSGSISALSSHWPDVETIVARIRPDNAASLRAFANAGYAHEGSEDNHLIYTRRTAAT